MVLRVMNQIFFLLCPGDTPNSGNDATHLAPKSHLVSGKEVVFFEMEWPGTPDLEHQKRMLYPLRYAPTGYQISYI